MKKADNFNIKQWLTENKVTTQSRLNENEFITSKFPTHLLKKLQEYINYYDMSENGTGEVNGMHATEYADLQKEKIKSQITNIKGEDYFDTLDYFANLNTFDGDEDKMEELAGKLGYTVEQLKDSLN